MTPLSWISNKLNDLAYYTLDEIGGRASDIVALALKGKPAGDLVPELPAKDTGENVILITVDGARHQDVFDQSGERFRDANEPPVFQHIVSGKAQSFLTRDVRVSNGTLHSLPGYESIFTGHPTQRQSNYVGDEAGYDLDYQTSFDTVQERTQRDLQLPYGKVATIASWRKIGFVANQSLGSTYVDVGLKDGMRKPPWGNARYDSDTFRLSSRYLEEARPRLMVIGFNDTDDQAHNGNKSGVVDAMRNVDRYVEALEKQLSEMGEYGKKTTLIVTADHGRADGRNWTTHGWYFPESAQIWMYAKGPHVDASKLRAITHDDIRPTIEKLLGLCPLTGEKRGKPIEAIASGVRDTCEAK